MALTTRTKITGALLGAALAGSVALVSLPDDGDGPGVATSTAGGEQRSTGRIALTDAKEGIPSRTATDWVSYGDRAAVVRVTAEHEQPDAAGEESERTEGTEDYVSRTVDLDVTDPVWARSGAPALPGSLTVTVDGWQTKDGGRVRVGSSGASRLEVGHTYVVAFARYADGEWAPLGSGGVLPYDGGRVGAGEFEGGTVTVEAYRTALERQLVPGEEEPVAFRTAGKPAAGVGAILRGTRPDPKAARYFGLDAAARHEKVSGEAEPADSFCSVAAPLAVSEDSRHTPEELADVLTDLSGLAPGDSTALRSYATSLRADGAADESSRKASAAVIEKECGIDVGDLRPSDSAG